MPKHFDQRPFFCHPTPASGLAESLRLQAPTSPRHPPCAQPSGLNPVPLARPARELAARGAGELTRPAALQDSGLPRDFHQKQTRHLAEIVRQERLPQNRPGDVRPIVTARDKEHP
jgi:hypothetical protein